MTKRISSISGLLIISLTFVCALCDRTSDLEYVIYNYADSDVEIIFYGLETNAFDPNDSVKTLSKGEELKVYHEEQLGTIQRSLTGTTYFCDSIRVKNIVRQIVAQKNYTYLKEWNFLKTTDYDGAYILTIDNTDF